MDFNQLKAFIVVAEELNFRKSAEILGMSQPPLTRLIASLEKELGTKLFDRTTRSVRLTGAGVLLLREAREIASAISRIETEVRNVGKVKAGSLDIGFSKTAFMARFPLLIDEFKSRFPKIKLNLQEDSIKGVLQGVKEGRYDLGFVEDILLENDLESHEISSETLGVLLPQKHPLAKRKEIQLQDLKDETIILHHRREAEAFYDKISHLLKGLTQRPKIYVKSDGESCPILVATGKGVSLTIAGSQNIVPQQTRFVPIKDMFLPMRVFWKKENNTPHLKTLLSFTIEKRSVLSQKSECLVLTSALGR